MNNTSTQFDSIIKNCKDIFTKKMKDYGSAWRILRTKSLTDQIFIKAQRIRSIDEKGTQKVDEGINPEFIGIVNYAAIALIQLELGDFEMSDTPDNTRALGELPAEKAHILYNKHITKAKDLMENKNHDYGEAWRDMRISSITDLILMKIMRIKQIEDNKGKTLISEGVDANYYDIINYAIFALIKLDENHN